MKDNFTALHRFFKGIGLEQIGFKEFQCSSTAVCNFR